MGNFSEAKPRRFAIGRTALLCLTAICALRFTTTVLNMGIYPEIANTFGFAREINTYFSVLIMVLLAVLAGKKPGFIDAKTFSALSALLLVFGCIILVHALASHNKLLVVIGLFSISAARNWVLVMVYVALSSLRKDEAVFAIGGGVLAAFLLYPLSTLLATTASVLVYCALPCLLVAPLYRKGAASIARAVQHESSVSEMRIMNPFSFLGPTHPILIAILLFNVAFGFSLSLNIQQTTPVMLSLIGIATVLASAMVLLLKKDRALDSLFSFSTLLVIGGYVASMTLLGSSSSLANTILTAGSAIFSILVYLVIASVIARNPWGMISLSSWAIAFGGLGTVVGADIGHVLNSLAAHDLHAAVLSIGIVLMLFVSYVWIHMRTFSFEKAIQGVAPVQDEDPKTLGVDFEGSIQSLSQSHGLTDRETEILLLLAKGRNSLFLQEHFVVSKNTIKTHIKHIYRKLDVHSQQEVIDLIEQHLNAR